MKPRHPLQKNAIGLRNKPTDVERRLWHHLRNRQLEGIKFRRQQPVEAYILDFVSFDRKLVIELDGSQHLEKTECDTQRDACLRANGFVVLRFWNSDVIENIQGVLEVIRRHCLKADTPTPQPPPARGGGAA